MAQLTLVERIIEAEHRRGVRHFASFRAEAKLSSTVKLAPECGAMRSMDAVSHRRKLRARMQLPLDFTTRALRAGARQRHGR